MTTNQELRKLAEELRRRPIPLADIIPALQRAADRIDRLEAEAFVINDVLATQTQRIAELKAENEAKDRLLEQARETISAIDQQIDLAKYPHAPDDITLLDISKASLDAITDHPKGKNHG